MEKSDQEMSDAMKGLSDLHDEIRKKIADYNRISKQVDNGSRLALLSAESGKGEDGDDDLYAEMTHEEFVSNGDDRPYCSVYDPDADGWFPSGLNC